MFQQTRNAPRRAAAALLALGLALLPGCVVQQPRGAGALRRLVEPSTQRGYYLYLPADYVAADPNAPAERRWPVVVSFHGMKPFDTAIFQAEEWEQEADRYGFIVVAPELVAFDVLKEFPLRTLSANFKSDEMAALAILDAAFAALPLDPDRVLATSWSSGGYMAHYMINRHPDRFTCLAVRQSNFAATILDPTLCPYSQYHPILILSTENDFPICKVESRDAIRWYETHGYRNLAWVFLSRLWHERTPDMAATFFAQLAGATPRTPPEVLVGRQALDGNPIGLALAGGQSGAFQARPLAAPQFARRAAPDRSRGAPAPAERSAPTGAPLSIYVSAPVGFEPLEIAYSADCPPEWRRTAQFTWELDGARLGEGPTGRSTIARAGDHTLALRALTDTGETHHARRQLRVLATPTERAAAAPPPAAR